MSQQLTVPVIKTPLPRALAEALGVPVDSLLGQATGRITGDASAGNNEIYFDVERSEAYLLFLLSLGGYTTDGTTHLGLHLQERTPGGAVIRFFDIGTLAPVAILSFAGWALSYPFPGLGPFSVPGSNFFRGTARWAANTNTLDYLASMNVLLVPRYRA